jgi:exportin-T
VSFSNLNLLTPDNTRTAFYDLPPELASKSGRDRQRRISINKQHIDSAMSSGRTTPENGMSEDSLAQQLPGVYYGGAKEVIDYEQFPLTPLGQLLNLCMTSGIASYPHPSVTLQYFEIGVRYVDFWKCKPGSVKPMFEAMLDSRGVHHPDEAVRRRCFYLFARFVRECKAELDLDMVPPILDSLRVSS